MRKLAAQKKWLSDQPDDRSAFQNNYTKKYTKNSRGVSNQVGEIIEDTKIDRQIKIPRELR